MSGNSASVTSAKYLSEIKAIYERLHGEYEYLRKKQGQHPKFKPTGEGVEAMFDGPEKLSKYPGLVTDFHSDSDGLETGTENHQTLNGNEAVDDGDQLMVASSVEEFMDSENASLRERISQLEGEVVAKNRDWRRIRANYEQIQESNEKLKAELKDANSTKKQLEAKYKQLNSRLVNLQACKNVKTGSNPSNIRSKLATSQPVAQNKPSASKSGDSERLLNLSLEALSEVSSLSVQHASKGLGSTISTNLLFTLAELMRNLPNSLASQGRVVESLLRLFYEALPWSLHPTSSGEDGSSSELRPGVSLSLHKCGETLFKSATSSSAFFRSSQLTIRFLSTLIILRTVTRADILAQALDSLLRDCQSEAGREAFLRFDASRVIVAFLRPHNKTFVGTSLAIVARLLSSTHLPNNQFTEIFLTERFVCALSMLLDSNVIVGEDLEKLTTILAKLASTARKASNQSKSLNIAIRLFNAFGITEAAQRMLKRLPTAEDVTLSYTPLISSNLRHIISSVSTPSAHSSTAASVNSHLHAIATVDANSSIGDDLSCGSLSIH